jgi:hypothetical protein
MQPFPSASGEVRRHSGNATLTAVVDTSSRCWMLRDLVDELCDLVRSTEGLRSNDLAGFFVDWPRPPSLDNRLEILNAADEVVVCRTVL